MATPAARTHLTSAEYVAFERKAIPDAKTVRSEYIDGEIINMSGASRVHNLITNNISGELRNVLKGSRCETYANDMRVSSPLTSSYFYPDVVVCEEPDFEDDVFDILLNPIILVEVFSPSTEAYDRGEKFGHYRHLSGTLQDFIQVFPAVTPNTKTELAFRSNATSVKLMFQSTSADINDAPRSRLFESASVKT